MKEKFVAVVAGLIMFAVAVCDAAPGRYDEIPKADVAIGGITLGADESYVKRIYGEPNEVSYKETRVFGRTKIFQYGNSFFVTFSINKKEWHVLEVKSTGNNGLKTPAGFTVGMKLSDVYNRYGPRVTGDNSVIYTSNWWLNIMFKGDKNGKITEIHIYPTP